MEVFSAWESPLGRILLFSDGEALTGLQFQGQRYGRDDLEDLPEAPELPVFQETRRWLCHYFAGELPDFCPPLRPRGSAFQLRVWALLGEIPYGETRSYGDLARALNCPSPRAVGAAVGRNPISLLLPCHRVLGAKGRLTGYAGGLWRKEALLRLEGVLPKEDQRRALP